MAAMRGIVVAISLAILGAPAGTARVKAAAAFAEAQAEPPLPDLPHPSLNSLAPSVQMQIQTAYDLAAAHPRAASANGKLGMFLHAYGLLADAEVSYTRARLLDPSSFRWAYLLGMVEAQEAKCSDAMDILGAALKIRPDYPPAKLALGQCLLVSQKWEDAAKVYESVLESQPDNAEAYYGLGRVKEAGKDLTAAMASYQKACQLSPKFTAAHFALARLYLRTGKPDLGKKEQGLAQEGQGAFPLTEDPVLAEVEALFTDPNSYIKLGTQLGGQGQWKEAAQAYEEALQIEPQLMEAHVRLIYLYTQLKDVAKAEEHFRAVIKLDPNKAEAYFLYGVMLLGQRRIQEAEEAFRNTLKCDPKFAQAYSNLGYLLEGEGKPAEAIEEFRKALEISPNFSQAHFSLGRILVKQGKFEEGIPHLLKAVEGADEATKPSYLYAVGIAFAELGDLENGVRYLRLASGKAASEKQSELLQRIQADEQLLGGHTKIP